LVYEYQGIIITVRPGLGGDNFSTCKRKPNGGWTTVKTAAMPRTGDVEKAINNLHAWAEKKGLRRADCGCCYYQAGNICQKYNAVLNSLNIVLVGNTLLRCPQCDEFEKGR